MRQFLNDDISVDFNSKENNQYKAKYNDISYVDDSKLKENDKDVEIVDFDGFDNLQNASSADVPESGFSFEEIKKDINDFNIIDNDIEIL